MEDEMERWEDTQISISPPFPASIEFHDLFPLDSQQIAFFDSGSGNILMVVENKPIWYDLALERKKKKKKNMERISIYEVDLMKGYVTIIRRINLSGVGKEIRRYTRLFRSSSKHAPI